MSRKSFQPNWPRPLPSVFKISSKLILSHPHSHLLRTSIVYHPCVQIVTKILKVRELFFSPLPHEEPDGQCDQQEQGAQGCRAQVAEVEDQAHAAADKGAVVIATVQGDIHDIGKNIVKLLLENYGFHVTDLGKDVSPQTVVDTVRQTGARLVALSALMTTTVPAMEQTIHLLRRELPACQIMVGGAVLTADYAAAIGADFYGADAMEAVRYAQSVYS